MCGVIGIVGSANLRQELYIAMMNMQHRGQSGAGMASYDFSKRNGSPLSIIKTLGPVSLLADARNDANNIQHIDGEFGMGHVRYATSGTNQLKDLMPIFIQYPMLVSAYNGNIVNYLSLLEQLEEIPFSSNDVEPLAKIYWEEFRKNKSPQGAIDAVKAVYAKVIGAYSVINMIPQLGMVAYRDPQGFRPLVCGRRNLEGRESYGFASEDGPLRHLGFSAIKDLPPGTVAIADLDRRLYFEEVRAEKHSHCMFEYVYFAGRDATLEETAVYEVRKKMGMLLAEETKRRKLEFDVVVPFPDTGSVAALGFAQYLGIPLELGLVKNEQMGRTFITDHQEKREAAVESKYKIVPSVFNRKKVALIEDSIVRGTTARKTIAHIRKQTIPLSLILCSTLPPVREPCYMGIDFSSKEELIANRMQMQQIPAHLGLDAVVFMPLEGIKRAIGLDDLCQGCLDGCYPIDVGEGEKLAKLRHQHLNMLHN